MNRSNKKMKLINDVAKSGYIQSGNFMTSCLHDQTEYTDEMPIASPDALNNEVPVNTINPENEEEINVSKVTNDHSIQISVNNSKLAQVVQRPSNAANLMAYNRNGRISDQLINSQNRSISGGLTLDKTNKSLKNLIYYIKTAYSNSLTSPKWKNFKGLKLQVIEKIRLNNVIWRTWFEQYGTKSSNKKKQRPLLCQFAITLEEPVASARVALLEGEYWKRRLCSITNEYKKWREISRKQIKSTNDGSISNDQSNQFIFNPNDKSILNNSLSSNNLNNVSYASNSTNYYENNQAITATYQLSHSQNNFDFINNTFYSNNNVNDSNILTNQSNTTYNNGQHNSHYCLPPSSTQSVGSNVVNNLNSYHPNKQIPYSNRCRSPSPGLFQDFDLYNFSSDTLFTTSCFEDQKDPIFGTNPDLFQPDLMHLYPNFDFLDLDIMNDGYSSNNLNNFDSNLGRQVNSFNSPRSTANSHASIPSQVGCNQQGVILTSSNSDMNSLNAVNLPLYIQPNDTTHDEINLQTHQQEQIQDQTKLDNHRSSVVNMSQRQTYITGDSPFLDNFNTLATVAAAQTPSISPDSEIRPRKNNLIKNNMSGKVLKSVNSLSQINTTDNSLALQQQNQPQNDKLSLTKMNNLNQSASTNGPSNTIRNLLALQSPLVSINNSNNNNHSNTNAANSNFRLTTGVVGLQSNNQAINRQNSFNKNLNSITIMQKQSTLNTLSSPSSSSALSSPATAISSPSLMDSTLKYQQDNQQLNALLSVVMSSPQPQINSNNNTLLPIQDSVNNDMILSRQKINANDSGKSRRGRKASSSIELLNDNSYDSRIGSLSNNNNINNTKTPQSISINSKNSSRDNLDSCQKSKKEKLNHQAKSSGKLNQFNSDKYVYMQSYPSDLNGLLANERNSHNHNSNSSSPIDSPNNQNSNSSLYSQNQSNISNLNNYNLIAGVQNNQNAEINNEFNTNVMQRGSSASNLNFIASMKLPTSLANSNDNHNMNVSNNNSNNNNLVGGSRTLSRSNSVSSINTMNDQVSTAEQKRRCNIQHGFDRLQTLVPSLRESKNSKASKAAMLQKTSEYIKELQRARQKRMSDLEVYKKEIEQLSDQISECQNQLPANGVSVMGNLNKTEKFDQKFKAYVKERTVDNWRFYLFSIILKPLFDNFIKTLNTSSKQDMERTFYEWQDKFCNLIQLRPIISNGLRQLSKSTSILTDSSKLPEECYTAALTKI